MAGPGTLRRSGVVFGFEYFDGMEAFVLGRFLVISNGGGLGTTATLYSPGIKATSKLPCSGRGNAVAASVRA